MADAPISVGEPPTIDIAFLCGKSVGVNVELKTPN
jgi:hypothetical protein